MKTNNTIKYQWAVVGAGPAGVAATGLLLDHGVNADQIAWIDPSFSAGDLGQHWGHVSSNTSVALFNEFFNGIRAFEYEHKSESFKLDGFNPEGFSELKHVAKPLQYVTNQLRKSVHSVEAKVDSMQVDGGCYQLKTSVQTIHAAKVILATGANPKSLRLQGPQEVPITTALNPDLLAKSCSKDDCVAVFGSSHSAMIIIRSLIEAGVKNIMNFYQGPIRYAVKMDGWMLYDNTGLKGETEKWTRENISKQCCPEVKRHISNSGNLEKYLPKCNKAIYAVGFERRAPTLNDAKIESYDISNGIIAPGLFGVGIGFPRHVVDPFGNHELNVGLWKFMDDIRKAMPLWLQYGL